ncbi:MAG: hypothetical protein IVW55_07380 [Chloroflexi bacterium]|nr:hypothetical protein [Chloroflexota bacterium]
MDKTNSRGKSTLQITGETRLNRVLDSIPGALDYIVSLNPHDFGRLRNPVMRRYMSPRISLRRVAAMARVEEERLIRDLARLRVGQGDEQGDEQADRGDKTLAFLARDSAQLLSSPRSAPLPQSSATPPPWMLGIDESCLHWVDLLPIDDVLGDPMLPVTVAVRHLQPGVTIGIRHKWEPQPLYDIWQKMGLEWFARKISPDEWHIFVHKPSHSPPWVPLAPSRSILVELRHIPENEVPARVLVAFEQLEPGESMEMWVEPGGLERALSMLQERHAGEFTWEMKETTGDRDVVGVVAHAPAVKLISAAKFGYKAEEPI